MFLTLEKYLITKHSHETSFRLFVSPWRAIPNFNLFFKVSMWLLFNFFIFNLQGYFVYDL